MVRLWQRPEFLERSFGSECRKGLLIPPCAFFDPAAQYRDLFVRELLFWRHVRIRIRTEHLKQLTVLTVTLRNNRTVFTPFEKTRPGREEQPALLLFGIMAAEAVPLQNDHCLGRECSRRFGRGQHSSR